MSALGANKVVLRLPAGTPNIFADFTIPSQVTLIPERNALVTRTGGTDLPPKGDSRVKSVASW